MKNEEKKHARSSSEEVKDQMMDSHKHHEEMEKGKEYAGDAMEHKHDSSAQSMVDKSAHNQQSHADHEMHVDSEKHIDHKNHQSHDVHQNHEGHQPDGGDAHKEHDGHGAHADHTGHEKMFREKFFVSTLLSIPVLLFSPAVQSWLGFSMPEFPGSNLITPVLAIFIFFYGGMPFLKLAVPEIKNRKPGMMTLISLAISVAFIYSIAALFLPTENSFFWELVTLIDIMLLGHWLEMRSIRQASGALNELAKLIPDTAERIRSDGEIEVVPVDKLQEGDLVLVRPGASVPSDGMVVEGVSDVNEAMITGESLPVKKEVDSKVIGGTINGDGSLRVRITATGDKTALAGIMRLVEQAQQSKSDTQILADKAAGWLFYIALGVALITAIVWSLAVGFNVEVVARVATVLVIACPHALGLAIPLVVAITTGKGAENGILIRDRVALEKAREIDIVIFDKTGTLTEGKFGVVASATIEDWRQEDALALAAAIEGDSEHTIARGIRSAAEEKGLVLPDITSFEAIKGRGVKAVYGEHTVFVGGPRLLEKLDLELPSELVSLRDTANTKGQSVVYLIQDGQAVAGFALADVIRPESQQTVDALHRMGIEVAMLTGDSEAVAKTVAEELGIDLYFAEVLPEQKDEKVAALQASGKSVAMVGDGVNDAPALTRADVGIAIGGGTEVAIESAGIILVQSNPLDVVKMINLSRASHRKMVQNLWWATGYNVVALPLAAGVLAPWGIVLSPAVGAILMSLSTIVVAINAQFLRKADLTSV